MGFLTYPIFAVVILGLAGVIVLAKKRVPHGALLFVALAFLASVFVFPERDIHLATRAIFATGLFFLGWIAYAIFGVIGAGVYKALAIVALWVPLSEAFDVNCAILILTGAWACVTLFYEKLVASRKEGAVPMAAITFLTVAWFFALEFQPANLAYVEVETSAVETPVTGLRR